MKEGSFEERRRKAWDEYEQLVASMERRKPIPGVSDLPKRFREVCADLALAHHRMYRGSIVGRLNELVIRGYKLLYRSRKRGRESFMKFVMHDFPAALRKERKLFWLCSAMFWVPFFGTMLLAKVDLDWVQAILGPEQMTQIEWMYGGDEEQISYFREEFGSNFMMFGHYIKNNVSIDLRIFAGGIVACLGTIFYIFYNGLAIGASAGYVNEACNPASFWTFVAGHSSFELLGMIVAGVAGMRLGLAVVAPGRMVRSKAIANAARLSLPLILGAAGMTCLAAVVEAFWSAQPLPASVKYTFGITMWVLHIFYFTFLGRRSREA